MAQIFCKKLKYVVVYPSIDAMPADNDFTELTGRGELTVQEQSDFESGTMFYGQTLNFQFTASQLTDKAVADNQHLFLKVQDESGNEYKIGTVGSNYNPWQPQSIRRENNLLYWTLARQSATIDI